MSYEWNCEQWPQEGFFFCNRIRAARRSWLAGTVRISSTCAAATRTQSLHQNRHPHRTCLDAGTGTILEWTSASPSTPRTRSTSTTRRRSTGSSRGWGWSSPPSRMRPRRISTSAVPLSSILRSSSLLLIASISLREFPACTTSRYEESSFELRKKCLLDLLS